MKAFDLTYPRKYICVMSSSLPTEQLDFNAIAQHIADSSPRKPFERMEALLKEKTYKR
jgi:hypothetical protein